MNNLKKYSCIPNEISEIESISLNHWPSTGENTDSVIFSIKEFVIREKKENTVSLQIRTKKI